LEFNPDTTGGLDFFEGFSSLRNDVTINLDALSAGGSFHLYVINASNRPDGQLQADGKLVVTLSTPISVVNPNCFNAGLNPNATNAAGTAKSLGALSQTQPVNTTLSADGLTLTFAPNYSTAPAATDRNVFITYDDGPPTGSTSCPAAPPPAPFLSGAIVEKDYPAVSHPVFTGTPLVFSDGSTTLSGKVFITGP